MPVGPLTSIPNNKYAFLLSEEADGVLDFSEGDVLPGCGKESPEGNLFSISLRDLLPGWIRYSSSEHENDNDIEVTEEQQHVIEFKLKPALERAFLWLSQCFRQSFL